MTGIARLLMICWGMFFCLTAPPDSIAQLTDTTRVSINDLDNYYEMENGFLGVRIPKSTLFDAGKPDHVPAPVRCIVYKDGTHSNDFPNYLLSRTPALTMHDTVLYETTDSCGISISYTFDKPDLITGAGLLEPAGPGYYRITIRMYKGEKACMVVEESDYEVGYEMKVSDGLSPDKGRYQGHQSTSIENGYDVNGGVYLRGNNEGYQATVDLSYTKRKDYPKTARWNPFVVNSGWHWQLYNDQANNDANTFGVFDGRTSQLLGVSASGVQIYTKPAAISDLHASCDTSGNCHYVWLTEDELWHQRIDSTGTATTPELVGTGLEVPFVFAHKNTVKILAIDPLAAAGYEKILIRKTGNDPFQTDTLDLDGTLVDPVLYGASNDTLDFVMYYGTRNGETGLLLYAAEFNENQFTYADILDDAFANRGASRPDMKRTQNGDILVTYTEGVSYQSYNLILNDSSHFVSAIPYLPLSTAATTFGCASDPRTGDFFYVRPNGSFVFVDMDRDTVDDTHLTPLGAFVNYNDTDLANRRSMATDADTNALAYHEGFYFWFEKSSDTWSALTGAAWDSIETAHVHYNPHTDLFYIAGKYKGKLARFSYNGSGNPVLEETYPTTEKVSAGVKVDHKRVAATGVYFPEIRFEWGIFAGKKGQDLEAVDEVQTIAKTQNRLSGLANKLEDYENDPLTFNATYENGGVYMSTADFQAIIQKVVSDNDFYTKLSAIDPFFKPVMDAWRDPGTTQTTVVFQSIVDNALELKDALIHGDGIYDIEYLYSGGANRMRRMGDQIAGLMADTKLTTVQRDSLKKLTGLFARILWDDDFVPLFVEHGLNFGTPNTPQAYTGQRWFFALNLSQDPEFSARALEVPLKMQEILEQQVNAAGAPRGTPHYMQIPMDLIAFASLQMKEAGIQDQFSSNDTLKLFSDFILHLLTPESVRFNNYRKLVSFGDGSEESAAVFGLMGTGYADVDTTLSRYLMHAYRNGAARGSDYGFITMAINHNLPDTTGLEGKIGTAHFPGYLSTMRSGTGTSNETATWFINGEWYLDHRNDDRGAVSIQALGAPLSLNYGSFFSPFVPGAHMKSTVVTEDKFPQWDEANQPFLLPNNQMWNNSFHLDFIGLENSTLSKATFNSDSAWTRTVTQFNPSPETPIILIRDTLRDTTNYHIWNFNFMSKGDVKTPAGDITPKPAIWDRFGGPYENPSSDIIFTLDPGIRKFEFTGADWTANPAGGIDWELYLPSDSTESATLNEWAHTFSPSAEASEYFITNGSDFVERQTILRVKGKKSFLAVIVPYHKGQRPANLSVTMSGDTLHVDCDDFNFETNEEFYTFDDGIKKVLTTYAGQVLTYGGATIEGGPMELEIKTDTIIARLHGTTGIRTVALPPGNWTPSRLSPNASYNTNTGKWELNHPNTDSVTNSFTGRYTEVVFLKSIKVSPKVFLQGPYNSSTGLMNDQLRSGGYIPLKEPYTDLNFTHLNSGGGEETWQAVLDITGDNAIVDWVFVELRDQNDPTVIVATRAALVQRDGDVTDLDGTSPIDFHELADDDYYVAVRHRNHLGVMTKDPVNIAAGATTEVDFTDGTTLTYGTNAQVDLGGGVMGIYSGNANGDATVKYNGASNDRVKILVKVGFANPNNIITGYYSEDVKMDGLIKYNGASNDRVAILINVGFTNPNNIIFEQLP